MTELSSRQPSGMPKLLMELSHVCKNKSWEGLDWLITPQLPD